MNIPANHPERVSLSNFATIFTDSQAILATHNNVPSHNSGQFNPLLHQPSEVLPPKGALSPKVCDCKPKNTDRPNPNSDILQIFLSMNEKLETVIQKQQVLENKLDELNARQKAFSVLLEDSSDDEPTSINSKAVIVQDFTSKFHITLPINTIEDLQSFDQKLTDNECKESLKGLLQTIDKGMTISQCITNILKVFFTREFAMNCNMSRSKSNKHIIQDYIFTQLVIGHVRSYFDTYKSQGSAPVTFKMVRSSFGIVLSNSRDWEGKRSSRQNRNSETSFL